MADQFPDNKPNQVSPADLSSPGKQSFKGTLDPSDRRDYRAISLKRRSILDLKLEGIKRGANFDLALLDSDNRLIGQSTNGSNRAESLRQEVAAGIYYLRIEHKQGSSKYALTAKASVKRDQAGNTLNSARNINVGNRATFYDDYVGTGDPKDYYKFKLKGDPSHRFQFDATGIDGNPIGNGLRAQILDSAGDVVETFAEFEANISEETVLAAGTYYLDLSAYFATNNTDYRMAVSAKGIKDRAGNKLADAGNVNVASRPKTYKDFIGRGDQIDYYTFTLDGAPSHDFSLSLAEPKNNLLNDPLTVRILNSSGNLVTASSTPTNGSAIAINRVLGEGTYFVEVTPRFTTADDVPYKLQLSSDRIPDQAGNTLATARNLGTVGSTTESYTDFVGEGDPLDIYQLNLTNAINTLNVNVSGKGSELLEDSVTLRLRNSAGTVITSLGSDFDGGAVNLEREGLAAGIYYVEVERRFSSYNRINYDIDLFALEEV